MPTISCGCSSIGSLSQMLIAPNGTTTPVDFTTVANPTRVEFLYERLKSVRALDYTGAITGSTTRFRRGVRNKSYLVQGVIAVQPSPGNLSTFLPYILGGTLGATGSGALADLDADGNDQEVTLASILPAFDAIVYRESHVAQYTNLKVAQAVLRGRTANGGDGSEFLELIIVVVGEQEIISQSTDPSPWPAVDPALPTGAEFLPYTFWESDLLVNGINVPADEWSLRLNNNLSIKFYNELFPQCVRSTGRDVMLDASVPATCDPIREVLSLNTTEGTAEIQLATPDPVTFHTQFRIPHAYSKWETPTTNARSEIMLPISIEGYGNNGDDELIVQNDATV